MQIKNIILTNYRLYKGVNKISFSLNSDKNIYLISGQNGFGKTTFLHSLLWCLYGRMITDIDDSIRKDIMLGGGYNAFLLGNLNIDQRQKLDNISPEVISRIKRQGYINEDRQIKDLSTYSITIEFTNVVIPSLPCHSLKIIRSFDIILAKESVEILIDNNLNELSNDLGSDIFINDFILNKDIARFFFFDSERIVALAETNTMEDRRRLASAYNEVLGVKKYEDLKKNLENLRLRFRKKSNDIENRNKLNRLIAKQQALQNVFTEQELKIQALQESLIPLRTQNEEYQIALIREGNSMSLAELNRIEKVVETTKQKDTEYKQKLKTFLEYAPFAIVGKLLQTTKQQVENDYSITKNAQHVVIQNNLISDITSDLLLALTNIKLDSDTSLQLQNEVHFVLEKYKGSENFKQQLIEVSKEEYNEFIAVFNNIIGTYKAEFERLADDYRKNKQTLERNARKIANTRNNENDSVIKDIRTKKNLVEEKIAETEMSIHLMFEEKGITTKELATLNKQISELQKKVSLDDSDTQKDILAEQLINELEAFLYNLKQEKKYSLEYRIRTIMNSLMHKEDFIGSVKVLLIDDGLDIELYTSDGRVIRKDSLSKGEQQLYATSILKALVDESGIVFPVFIDSPLQKFDKTHSNKIITEFYPTISKQVVLFPLLHKELTESELDLMKPLVDSAYLIVNENTHSSIKQVDLEKLMQE